MTGLRHHGPMAGTATDRPRTSLRTDWILTGLAIWLVGGFYVDLWAHHHGEVDDTFFTPWHAVLYTAAVAFGVVLGAVALRDPRRGLPLRASLPATYWVGFLGSLLFIVAGLLDLAWHAVFGFEGDIEALLSPTHLLLATSGLMMIGTPLRSADARMLGGRAFSWRLAGPFIIPLAMILAIFGAFTQYAHPIVDVWSSRIEGSPIESGAQLFAMAPDGTGQRRLAILPGDARSPTFSPDGSRIAYSFGALDDDRQIHVMSSDGTADRVLTNEGSNIRPAWSPDGSRIAFSSTRDGGDFDLFVMDADGSNARRLTNDPAEDWAATWTPDGSAIGFNSNRAGDYDLYRVGVDTIDVTQLTSGPANDWEPAYSPDGSSIAFTSDRGPDLGVWVAAADGSDVAPLDIGDGDGTMPAWSPDAARIAFTSRRTGDGEVFVVPASGGEPTNLTQNPAAEEGWVVPAWDPAGTTIAYPSEGVLPADRAPFVREGFGAAGILIFAALMAGAVVYARRRGQLPFGAYTILIAVPAILATVLEDQERFIAGALIAGVLVDLLARVWPAATSRRGDAAFAFLAPAVFFAFYFATVALTDGIGWTIHLWLGAILTAGVIGLLLDELARRPGDAALGSPTSGDRRSG